MASKELDKMYGGQAVLDGVMIRSRYSAAICVRKPDGTLANKYESVPNVPIPIFKNIPFIRGMFVILESLILGFRGLTYSSLVASEAEDEKVDMISIIISVLLGVSFGVGFFFILPLFVSSPLERYIDSNIVINLIEAFIRLLFVLGYIFLISKFLKIGQLFMYHGAEHMVIHAEENKDELGVNSVKKYPIEHPRCGTAFILYVGIVAFFVLAFTPRDPIWLGIIVRIVTIPIIAGLSYEIIRFSSTFGNTKVGNILSIPTIALQKLTTATPNESQIEVALMAMNKLKEFDEEVLLRRNEKAI